MTTHKITGLYIYPIKSLGGISVSSSICELEGLQYDRRWMLVDQNGQFLTQRENAELALFSCALEEKKLIVKYKTKTITIPFGHTNEIKNVKVWSSNLKANEVSHEASQWFSALLKQETYLVKMTDISKRHKILLTKPFSTYVSFADGYPYLILSEGSMKTLNEKLSTPLPADRFRANILVDSSQAHIEDSWRNFQLGTAELKVIKPCARCVVTTIDQKTGQKGKEPLKTLASYRQKDNKIYFGANAIMIKSGIINVGDQLSF